jgi:hypothetical protein
MLADMTDYHVILNPIRGNRISCPGIVREALSAGSDAIACAVWPPFGEAYLWRQPTDDYHFKRPDDHYANLNPVFGHVMQGDKTREALAAMAAAIEQPVWQCQFDFDGFRRVQHSGLNNSRG